MIIASLDFETDSLDAAQGRVTEVGCVLYSTGAGRILSTDGYLINNEIPISAEITKITGIHKNMIDLVGMGPKAGLQRLLNLIDIADTIVGQNVIDFDLHFLENWCTREKEDFPKDRLVIDTYTDLPGVEGKHLGYQAADHGFLNLFPHGAVTDCLTVVKLISMHNFEEILVRAQSPRVTIQALVNYDNNALAKARKYRWDPASKVWYKVVKEMDLDQEAKDAPFDIKRIASIAVR
jgi:DNA polymerase III epsilon subunit-like protein